MTGRPAGPGLPSGPAVKGTGETRAAPLPAAPGVKIAAPHLEQLMLNEGRISIE